MSLTVTILGCGSSGGVPRVGGDWGLCDPANPKNRRRRCSILLEHRTASGSTRVLIDTSPDLRDQMLSADVRDIDGVWYTHEHADHTHGIDELRGFYLRQRKRVPVWADAPTSAMLMARFAYCFLQPDGSDYPPILQHHHIEAGKDFATDGAGGPITSSPFVVQHGNIGALGFRVGNLAYTPDLNAIPDASLKYLQGLDIWVVDALKRTSHPSHFSLPETLDWIARLQPKRAILTNMHIDMDYAKLCEELPHHVKPAYDGMTFTV
jgi:phosphoribosyl 1,2-cyclic phosphate phosphodiesterase